MSNGYDPIFIPYQTDAGVAIIEFDGNLITDGEHRRMLRMDLTARASYALAILNGDATETARIEAEWA